VRALTICQPYAEYIAQGAKLTENRTWPSSYRGPVLIHAGRSHKFLPHQDMGRLAREFGRPLEFGAIIALAEMVDCLEAVKIRAGLYDERYPQLRDHEHVEGPWCFLLKNARRLTKPISCSGALGFWRITSEIHDAINELGNEM
jgi:hypothetical protein